MMKVENKSAIYTDYEDRFVDYFKARYRSGKNLPLSTQKTFWKWRKALGLLQKEGTNTAEGVSTTDQTKDNKIGFRATVSNLELLCKTAGVSPNDILLPPVEQKYAVEGIQFLERSSVLRFCEGIRRNPPKRSFYVPIIYDPLRLVFLSVYVDCDEREQKIIYLITDPADISDDESMNTEDKTNKLYGRDDILSMLATYPVLANPLEEDNTLTKEPVEFCFRAGRGYSSEEAYARAILYYKVRRERVAHMVTEHSRAAEEVAKYIPKEERRGKLFEVFSVEEKAVVRRSLDDPRSSLEKMIKQAESRTLSFQVP